MNRLNVAGVTILSLLLGATGVVNAQRDQQGEKGKGKPAAPAQPARSTNQPARSSPQPHPVQAGRPAPGPPRQVQSYGGAYHGGVQYNGPTNGGVHASGVPQHQGQVRSGFVQSKAGSWGSEHQSWTQRGGYNGYRIPQNRFSLYFGHDHFFRIAGLPLVFVGGQPRFQYDGYWMTIVDPWPEDWAPNWYESDDVYLDYNGDGYYLYDQQHPGIPIAVTITF